MPNEAVTKIQYTSYNLQDAWLKEIAPHFFEIDDLNLMRTGLFGYVNEVMANSVEQSFLTTTLLANEVFPNKAVLPDSIYAYAALAQYKDFNAQPAGINCILAIKIDDLIQMATYDNNTKMLHYDIDKYSKVIIEDKFSYVLDYDVKIRIKEINGKYNYICTWDLIKKNNWFSKISSPYIKYTTLNIQNTDFLVLGLHALQLELKTLTMTIQNNDIVDLTNYSFRYEGNLADFNVIYDNPKTGENFKLDKYYVDTFKRNGGRMCYYSFTGTNEVLVKFSNYPGFFRPEYGSTLTFEILTTQGSKGNFDYNGKNMRFIFNNKDEYEKPIHFVNMLGNSHGGVDKQSINEVKDAVIREFSMRGNIITENDLQNYFDSRMNINKILFTKKQDDIITRLYSAFLLMRDKDKQLIPSNTMNMLIFDKQLENNEFIKPGTIFESYDDVMRIVKIPDKKYDEMDILDIDRKHEKFLYTCPFLIRINKRPFYSVFYMTSINKNTGTNISFINESSLTEINIPIVKVERNAIFSDSYKLSFELISNEELGTVNIPNPDKIKVYGIIKVNGAAAGYIKFKPIKYDQVNNKLTYEANLITNDVISTDDKICITNSIYELSMANELTKAEFYLDSKIDITLNCFMKNDSNTSMKKLGIENYIPSLGDNYVLVNSYDTIENLTLFESMGTYIQSPISLKLMPNATDGYYYILRMVPLIRYLYLTQFDNMESISKNIINYKYQMDEVMRYLENNFSIDMKFYNTFGKARYYILNNNKDEKLDIINVSIELVIRLRTGSPDSITASIEEYIEQYIEETNNVKNDFLYISNLIRSLELEFEDIININFKKINKYDTNIQSIENIFENVQDLTREELYNFVPEYINIDKKAYKDKHSNITFKRQINIKYI